MSKIIWLAHESNISGANLCLLEYIEYLNDLGHSQLLIVPHKGNLILRASEIGVQGKIIHYYLWVVKDNLQIFNSYLLKRFVRNFTAILQLIVLIIKFKPDYVCTNTATFQVGAIASKLLLKKHYWFIHEYCTLDHGLKYIFGEKFSHKLINLLSAKVIVNSECIYKYYSRFINKDKIILQYYLMKMDNFSKLSTDYSIVKKNKINLLILGQISKGKGHIDVIEALNNVHKKESFNLNIIGNYSDMNYYTTIINKVRDLDLSENVSIHNYISNPQNIILAHDYLIMASRNEAFGRVTLEAIKLGVPVIGYNSGGTKEILEDGKSGYLYNSSEELTNLLNELEIDRSKHSNLKKNTLLIANERFNYHKLANHFQEIFHHL